MAFEIRHNPFDNAHENVHFRRLANSLKDFFDKKGWDGLMIGNPHCKDEERLLPDIVLYTPHSFLLIDMKDYKGKVIIPPEKNFESEIWWLEPENGPKTQIKGGSYLNPFLQLKTYREITKNIFRHYGESNPEFTNAINPVYMNILVVFSGNIELNREVSGKFNRYFNITDEKRLLDFITDKATSDIQFSEESARLIKSIFRADPYNLHEITALEEIKQQVKEEYKLWDNQEKVISDIFNFLQDKNKRILIIKGPEQCGKSFLISPIREKAFELGIKQVETLAISTRVAERLTNTGESRFLSLYAYIYGGSERSSIVSKKDKEEETDKEVLVSAEELLEEDSGERATFDGQNNQDAMIEIIPLKNTMNVDEDALFILDEAHLINDAFHRTALMQFGSGRLLSDFLKFIDFDNSDRKIIFIGDPYQISYGKDEKSAISFTAYTEYDNLPEQVSIVTMEEKTCDDVSERIMENYKIARQIDTGYFNKLYIHPNHAIDLAKKEQMEGLILNQGVREMDPMSSLKFTILTYTNSAARDVNNWIRAEMLERKEELEVGDILMMDNNILLPREDAFSKPRRIVNGTYLWVHGVGDFKDVKIKGWPILTFRQLDVSVIGKTEVISIWILMNHFRAENHELSYDEEIALKIFFNMEVAKERKKHPFEDDLWYGEMQRSTELKQLKEEETVLRRRLDMGEKVKGELKKKQIEIRKFEKPFKREHSRNLKLKVLYENPFIQSAHVRFGWAMTVHKSLGQRWQTIIFNTEYHQGKYNKNYFQWLYSGISRAENKLHLLNFDPIDPFKNLNLTESTDAIAVHQEITNRNLPVMLLEEADEAFKEEYFPEEIPVNAVNYAFTLSKKFRLNGFRINDILPNLRGYQIKIKIERAALTSTIMFYFNNKGKVKQAAVERSETEDLKKELEKIISSLESSSETGGTESTGIALPDDFRADIYRQWINCFEEKNITLKSIEHHNYQDKCVVARENDWLEFIFYYNNRGFITSISPTKANKPELWKEIVECIKRIKDE